MASGKALLHKGAVEGRGRRCTCLVIVSIGCSVTVLLLGSGDYLKIGMQVGDTHPHKYMPISLSMFGEAATTAPTAHPTMPPGHALCSSPNPEVVALGLASGRIPDSALSASSGDAHKIRITKETKHALKLAHADCWSYDERASIGAID